MGIPNSFSSVVSIVQLLGVVEVDGFTALFCVSYIFYILCSQTIISVGLHARL